MNSRKICGVIGLCAMAFGLSLIFCAGFLVVNNIRENRDAERFQEFAREQLDAGISSNPVLEFLSSPDFVPDYKLNPNMPMPVLDIDGVEYIGELEIPDLGLEFAVRSEWSYSGLKQSPCRYNGSAYLGNLSICAHNYDSHFGRLSNLEIGGLVYFTDVDGNEFAYQVAEIQELDPYDSENILTGSHDLSLFTCTLGGRTRICVFCDEI